MNKKGFMFVETIVTLTALVALLVVLYTTFTNLLNQEKVNAEYEKRSDRYMLYYAKERMGGTFIESHKNTYFSYWYEHLRGWVPWPLDNNSKACNVAIIECGTSTNITKSGTCILTKDFENYVGEIKEKSCQDGAKYMIAGEFENYKNNFSYAYIYYPNIKVADTE